MTSGRRAIGITARLQNAFVLHGDGSPAASDPQPPVRGPWRGIVRSAARHTLARSAEDPLERPYPAAQLVLCGHEDLEFGDSSLKGLAA